MAHVDKNNKTFKLSFTSLMLALGTVLSMLTLFRLPFGGSVTPFSMLPLITVSCIYGIKWGLFSGLVYGVLQAVLGATMSGAFEAQGILNVILICAIDYLIAYTVVGLSGMFAKRKKTAFLLSGAFCAMLLRYVCHVVSGAMLYGSWAEWYFTQEGFYSWGQALVEKHSGFTLSLIYSVIYNAMYMVPEIIVTLAVATVVFSIKPVRKLLADIK